MNFPVDAQLPPAASVGRPFSFTISSATFVSPLAVKYSAKGLPAWLRFDVFTRTLSGTPAEEDVGSVSIVLEAADSEGSAATAVNLTVRAENSLEINRDQFTRQLGRTGSYSAPSTLLLYPQTYFDLDFGQNVFTGADGGLEFYAVSDNHAPLPAWIRFDEGSVSFSGTTPSLLTPQSSPQTFNFSLLASQIPGYSQSAVDFQISVTNHILAFSHPIQSLNVSAGVSVSIPPLIEQLRYDNIPIPRASLSKVSSSQPDWLSFESRDLSFSGLAPESINSTLVRVEATDNSNNIAFAEIRLLASDLDGDGPQATHLGTANATVGKFFSYTFDDIELDGVTSRIDVSFDAESAGSWLTFTQANKSIEGIPPSSFVGNKIDVSITTVVDGRSIKRERLIVLIVDVDESTNTPILGSGIVPGPTTPVTPKYSGSDANTHKIGSKDVWAIAITIPALTVLLLCISVVYLFRRARKRRDKNVSDPTPAGEDLQSRGSGNSAVLEESDFQFETTWPPRHSSVPQVRLAWTNDLPVIRKLRNDAVNESPETRSSWDDMLMDVGRHSRGEDFGDQSHANAFCSLRPVHGSIGHRSDQDILPTRYTNHTEQLCFGHERPSVPYPTFNGRRSSGLGHGTNIKNPVMDSRQSTQSPFSKSPITMKILQEEVVRQPFGQRIEWLPGIKESDNTAENRDWRETSFESNFSKSNPLAESIEEDNGWRTEDSTSISSNWYTHRASNGGTIYSNGTSLNRSQPRRLVDNAPEFGDGTISKGTSMRSQNSEQSGSNSLRFI